MPTYSFTPLRGGALGSSLSIGTKGLMLIAIPVLCQLIILGLLRQIQTNAAEAERWAIHSKNVLVAADEGYRLMLQAVASQRASVIAEEADFERELTPEPGAIARHLETLASLVGDSPTQSARVRQLRTDGIALESWLASQHALVRAGRAEEAASRISAGEGRDRLERIGSTMAAFLAAERQVDEQRVAQVRAFNERGRLLTTLAALVSLLVAGLLAYVFSRSISGRLAIVTSNARLLAAGEPLATPVAGSDEIAQLDAVLHDTSQRLAEAAATAEHARVEVERRADELAIVNRELAQQTQENELFIYSVSHDLRSPLVNLQGFSKELVRSCEELRRVLHDDEVPARFRSSVAVLTEQEIPESVHFIRTAVTRASAIIDALLRLSRVGRVDYLWQQVDVARTVTTVLDAMRATINERQAAIVVHPLAPAWGDPTAVEQVFANLIGNAANYLDPDRPGQIEIGMVPASAPASASAPEPETALAPASEGAPALAIAASAPASEPAAADAERPRPSRVDSTGEPAIGDDRFVTYYVRDNGLGIPAASVNKVFIAFQRLHANRARGEGIGLAVVRRIVERHRGRIWVESTEGVGSTFFVMFPLDAAAAGVAVDPTAPAEEE